MSKMNLNVDTTKLNVSVQYSFIFDPETDHFLKLHSIFYIKSNNVFAKKISYMRSILELRK